MPGIVLKTTLTDTSLPTSKPLSDRIKEIPSLVMWAQADASHTTLIGGEISAFADKAGGAGVFAEVSPSTRADLVPNGLNGFAVARFNGLTAPDDGAADEYALSGVVLDTSSPYTYVGIFRLEDIADHTVIVGRLTDSVTRSILATDGVGQLSLLHGTTNPIAAQLAADVWYLVIASYDGTKVKMEINGIPQVERNASGATGATPIYLGALSAAGGQAIDGDIADVMLFSSDILGDPASASVIREYASAVYGL